MFILASWWMFILEKQRWRRKAPALNDDRLVMSEKNVIESTKTGRYFGNNEGDKYQESGEAGTRGLVRCIAMVRIQLRSGTEF